VEQAPLSGILSAWFSRAKTWWGIALVAQLAASLIAAVSVLVNGASLELALVVAVVGCAAAAALWRSEVLRHDAEALLRHVELEDAFGWAVDAKILADSVSRALPLARRVSVRGREQGAFFSSTVAKGPQRALENVQESAWWSHHLSQLMAKISGGAACVLIVLSLWSLLLAASALGTTGPLVLSNIVTAILSIAFTGNVLRLPFDYMRFARTANEYDRKSKELLARGNPTESEGLRIIADYQLERSRAPLLPDWAWRLRREALNNIWRTYRHGK
jgi:hypothetical protein